MGAASLAPAAGHRPEDIRLRLDQHGLLFRGQLHHTPVVVRMPERCEDALADPKVGMPLVRAFDHTGQRKRDTAKAVREVKAGRVEFKVDKAGNVHVAVGKVNFPAEHIVDNARTVIETVSKARPAAVKGIFLQSCTLSATMSPPVRLDVREWVQH